MYTTTVRKEFVSDGKRYQFEVVVEGQDLHESIVLVNREQVLNFLNKVIAQQEGILSLEVHAAELYKQINYDDSGPIYANEIRFSEASPRFPVKNQWLNRLLYRFFYTFDYTASYRQTTFND